MPALSLLPTREIPTGTESRRPDEEVQVCHGGQPPSNHGCANETCDSVNPVSSDIAAGSIVGRWTCVNSTVNSKGSDINKRAPVPAFSTRPWHTLDPPSLAHPSLFLLPYSVCTWGADLSWTWQCCMHLPCYSCSNLDLRSLTQFLPQTGPLLDWPHL